MSSFTTAGGVRLNYRDAGSGAPVVLVAGHTAPLSTWGLLEAALVEAGHRVIAVDRRHCGASDFPDGGMRMARQGADIHEFLAGLDLDDAVVVASSLGVSATWAMIDTFGCGRLAGAVFVDQTPKMVNEGGWEHGLYDLTWENLAEFVAGFGLPPGQADTRFKRPPVAAPAPEVLPLLAEALAQPYPHERMQPLLRDHAVQDWRDVLATIDVPVLAIGGRHSELWPVQHAEFIAAAAPKADLRILEDCGHAPMWHNPTVFNTAVVDWVTALRR